MWRVTEVKELLYAMMQCVSCRQKWGIDPWTEITLVTKKKLFLPAPPPAPPNMQVTSLHSVLSYKTKKTVCNEFDNLDSLMLS